MKLIIILAFISLISCRKAKIHPPLKLTSIRGTPLIFDFTKGTDTCLKMALPTLESSQTSDTQTYLIELSGSLMASFTIDEANYNIMINYFRKHWRLTPISDGCLMVSKKYPLYIKRKVYINGYMRSEQILSENVKMLIEAATKDLNKDPNMKVNVKDLKYYLGLFIDMVKGQKKEFSRISRVLYGRNDSQMFNKRMDTLYSNLYIDLFLEDDSNKELLDFIRRVLNHVLAKDSSSSRIKL
jgi:hypothetical protein